MHLYVVQRHGHTTKPKHSYTYIHPFMIHTFINSFVHTSTHTPTTTTTITTYNHLYIYKHLHRTGQQHVKYGNLKDGSWLETKIESFNLSCCLWSPNNNNIHIAYIYIYITGHLTFLTNKRQNIKIHILKQTNHKKIIFYVCCFTFCIYWIVLYIRLKF